MASEKFAIAHGGVVRIWILLTVTIAARRFNVPRAKFSNRVARPFLPVPMQKELDAWKKTRRLRIDYRTPNQAQPTRRDIDIHALFLAKDAWYARAWCHWRNNFRSFALHRIVAAELLPERFARSAVVVADVAQGKLFDCNYCTNVQVRVASAHALYFQERPWFPGQQVTRRPDGALDVTYPAIPEPLLVQWVLSFQGAVAVTAPETTRAAIRDAGAAIVQGHAPRH